MRAGVALGGGGEPMSKINRRDALKNAIKLSAGGLSALAVAGTPLLASQKPPIERDATPVGPFPKSGIDSFLSHFIIAIKFSKGKLAGQLISLALPAAIQTVARSEPFIYRGSGNQSARLQLPNGSNLASTINETDFFVKPPGFFTAGKQHVWLQILDIDAKTETAAGTIRIILGDTFKKEYPDLFEHSLGVAESLGASGFPAKLFFSPNSIIETPFGRFKTRAGKALVGERITQFPPIGSAPTLFEPVPIDSVEDLRTSQKGKTSLRPVALSAPFQTSTSTGTSSGTITGLSHPIDGTNSAA